jgi:hypothetical protein
MEWHRRLRLVLGFPTPYCSHAGSIRRDQAVGFPPAHGGFGVGGGITSGDHDGIGWSSERPVAAVSSSGSLVGLTPTKGFREHAFRSRRSIPCSPRASPQEGYFGLDSMILLVRGHQGHRRAFSMPQEGQGRSCDGRGPAYWSHTHFHLLAGPVRPLGRSELMLGAVGERFLWN